MNLRDLAKKIPDGVRGQRILTSADPIHNATPAAHDQSMMLLAEIWYTWVDPSAIKAYCPICLDNLLKNFRAIYDDLIDLEKEYNTLNAITVNYLDYLPIK